MRDPVRVVQIPGYGLAQSGIEALRGRPLELDGDLRRVHRVTTIVSRAVLHEGNQHGMWLLAIGSRLVEQRADCVHHLEIGLLVVATDVVTLADAAVLEDLSDRRAMILHVQPEIGRASCRERVWTSLVAL